MINLSEDNNSFVCTVDRSTIKFNIFFPRRDIYLYGTGNILMMRYWDLGKMESTLKRQIYSIAVCMIVYTTNTNTRCSITSDVGSSMLAWLGRAAISAGRLFTVDDKHIKIVLRSFWRLIKQTTV